MNINLKERFWEIDSLRGIAIIMMIISNFVTDLNYFDVFEVDVGGFWWYFAYVTASIFILLVGVSLTLSYSRAKLQGNVNYKKYLRRGLKIFSWGLIISMVTWAFMGNGFVVFGVLHLIGISIVLAYPLLRFKYLNLLTGVAIILAGIYLQGFAFGFLWLLWLGFIPAGFYSIDYFPILPWFGLVLIGLFAGNISYKNYKRGFRIPDFSGFSPVRSLCFLGRHSLLIYLIHQPLLIVLIQFVIGGTHGMIWR